MRGWRRTPVKAIPLGCALILVSLMPISGLASRGGTDANGGHYNHETGRYHYHHGYPEHQHENGICPYTGEKWELKIPEKPPTLEKWYAQEHEPGETPGLDNEIPENDSWVEETGEPAASAHENRAEQTQAAGPADNDRPVLPAVAAAGGAALLGGAVAVSRKRKRKPDMEEAAGGASASGNSEPEVDLSPEAVIPAGTVIGEDGLPWEEEAYEREKARERLNGPMPGTDNSVATNFSEPKWGALYSFCTDADGEEIHTLTCEQAFIQINVADKHCPKLDCPICRPVRPDLGWYQEYLRRKAAQAADKSENG